MKKEIISCMSQYFTFLINHLLPSSQLFAEAMNRAKLALYGFGA